MKIALCFITYDNLSQPKLWHRVISSNHSKLNVYIHNKCDFVDKEYNLEKYCIKNKVETKWGHISLIKATLALLREAFLDQDILDLKIINALYNLRPMKGFENLSKADEYSKEEFKNKYIKMVKR